jgi:sulfite reductase (NADPH) hemoprotein beta-component
MAKHGVEDETIITRITGCPNGCGRAMLAEIALVGKAPGRYNLHVGGNLIGTRIPKLYKENIATDEIIGIIDGWVKDWSEAREVGESFGDFAIRREIVKPVVNAATDFWAN